MKIAVVVLDDLEVEGHGDFGDMGIRLLREVIGNGGDTITKFEYVKRGELPQVEEFDLIYLTGSRRDSYLDVDFNKRLIEFVLEAMKWKDVKLLGICFGHQIIARALGMQVIKNPLGWEIGQYDTGAYVTSMFHQDIVIGQVPEGIESVGGTEKSPIQTFRSMGMLTFQGHPEFSDEYTLGLSENAWRSGRIGEDVHAETIARKASIPNDNRQYSMIHEFIVDSK